MLIKARQGIKSSGNGVRVVRNQVGAKNPPESSGRAASTFNYGLIIPPGPVIFYFAKIGEGRRVNLVMEADHRVPLVRHCKLCSKGSLYLSTY